MCVPCDRDYCDMPDDVGNGEEKYRRCGECAAFLISHRPASLSSPQTAKYTVPFPPDLPILLSSPLPVSPNLPRQVRHNPPQRAESLHPILLNK